MTDVILWHNPRCSKSRAALKRLEERGHAVTQRRYLDDPPSEADLRDTLALLGLPALALMRRKEPEFHALGLTQDTDEAVLISAMATTPKLIERPVAFANGKAALGRPPEAILDIL